MQYLNEHDPFAASWLRALIQAGELPEATVDERDIRDVKGTELDGYSQCHWFGGIGGWPLALRLAGWGDREVWTGSCPCQPFSAAGKRKGQADERHLWPAWFELIRERHPECIIGEQVASAIGHGWLDGVFADLEAEGYACGAVVLGAHSVGAPHIRQRLFWVADARCSTGERHARGLPAAEAGVSGTRELNGDLPVGFGDGGTVGVVADSGHEQARRAARSSQASGWRAFGEPSGHSEPGGMEHATGDGREQRRAEPDGRSVASGCGTGGLADADGRLSGDRGLQPGGEHGQQPQDGSSGFWSDFDTVHCRDGKTRRVPKLESGIQPLAYGIRNRVGTLRGAGNAIVPALAAEFIKAFMECFE